MGHLLLPAVIAAALWGLSLWRHPYRPCPRCTPHTSRRGGAGRNRGSSRRRFGPCARCDGTGRVRRIGARALHAAIQAARSRGKRD